MPQQWIKAFKFEWELPYNSWLLRLKRADLKPNVLDKGNPKGNKSVSIFRDNSLYSISVKTK